MNDQSERPASDALAAFKAQAQNNRRQRQDQIPDGIYNAISERVTITPTDITIWFQLLDHKVIVSEYYSPTGPKVAQLEKALAIKVSELQNKDQLVGCYCRLQLRRNVGYPRYKVLAILPAEEAQ